MDGWMDGLVAVGRCHLWDRRGKGMCDDMRMMRAAVLVFALLRRGTCCFPSAFTEWFDRRSRCRWFGVQAGQDVVWQETASVVVQ